MIAPMRILSLLPSATEIVYSLDLEDSLCAVTLVRLNRAKRPSGHRRQPRADSLPQPTVGLLFILARSGWREL